MPEPIDRRLWRVFPWDPVAAPGEPFSPDYFPPQAGTGRFDLPAEVGESALYLAETPEHAVGERLQDLRGQWLDDADLIEHEHRLALVAVMLPSRVAERVVDLCDAEVLARRGIRPDHLASRRRSITQSIARRLHDDGENAGCRWWSAFDGDWHTIVLFRSRVAGLEYDTPQHLVIDHVSVVQAAEALGIERRSIS